MIWQWYCRSEGSLLLGVDARRYRRRGGLRANLKRGGTRESGCQELPEHYEGEVEAHEGKGSSV